MTFDTARSVLLAMLTGLVLTARIANADVATAVPDADTDQNRKIPEFKLESPTPLESAIEALRNTAHANIVVDWPSLLDAGVKRDAQVRICLWNVTLNEALRAVIAVADYHGLVSFQMQDGVTMVAAREKLWRAGRVVRVYDVRPIIEDLRASRRLHTPTTQPNQQSAAASSHPGMAITADEATDAIVRLIQTTAVSDGWQHGSTAADFVRPFAGRLIISQTPENHRKIAGLLRALRERGTTEGAALFGQ